MNSHNMLLLSTAIPASVTPGVVFGRWQPPTKLESYEDLVSQAKILKGIIATFRGAERFVATSEAEIAQHERVLADAERCVTEAESSFRSAEQNLIDARAKLTTAEQDRAVALERLDELCIVVRAATEVINHPDYQGAPIAAKRIIETFHGLTL